jgi:peptidoglycan-associated lipoprotein
MKISKQILPLTLVLFLVFASGCSKNLIQPGDGEPLLAETDTSSGAYEKPGPSQDFGSAKQGMPGDGSAGSFSGQPFVADSGGIDSGSTGGGDSSPGTYEKPDSIQDFGSAKKGMPGDGATGSFSAEPSVADSGALSSKGDGDTGAVASSSGGYEKPGPGPDFGSAKQGMPGDGATGSFSAEPLVADSGASAEPEPDSGTIREENGGAGDGSSARLYEKPDSYQDFGSAKQGMPGNGASGSFSAEPAGPGESVEPLDAKPLVASASVGENGESLPNEDDIGTDVDESEIARAVDAFVPEESAALPLSKAEEIRRQLPYHPTELLQDIHFAFDKYDLDDTSKAILQENAAYMKSHPNAKIEIQGHCDERGSNNYNITLGERRAQSTKSYLASQGVDEGRIHTISYGEEKPFCFENYEKCWQQNRRAHFLVAE